MQSSFSATSQPQRLYLGHTAALYLSELIIKCFQIVANMLFGSLARSEGNA